MKYLKAALLIYLSLVVSFLQNTQTIFAQEYLNTKTTIRATVGGKSLSIEGYHSPYASVVLRDQDNTFMGSTATTQDGFFSFINIPIKDTLTSICLTAYGLKKIGESKTCIPVNVKSNNQLKLTDIFLPPSIAISDKKINAGNSAVIYGYSMPKSTVLLKINDRYVELDADDSGYYRYTLKGTSVGKYRIKATAVLSATDSLEPENEIDLEVISVTDQIKQSGIEIQTKVAGFVSKNALPIIVTGISVLAIISVVIYIIKGYFKSHK